MYAKYLTKQFVPIYMQKRYHIEDGGWLYHDSSSNLISYKYVYKKSKQVFSDKEQIK